MNRSRYFNYIEEKLNLLGQRIHARGKLNILDLNIQAEVFYMFLFNHIYGYSLKNANESKSNYAAIDLIDTTNKIVIQVSATASFSKIQSSLTEDLVSYQFKFISLVKDASSLKTKVFDIPNTLAFTPKDDIYDIPTILQDILYLDIDKQKNLYHFIEKELGNKDKGVNLESNLTIVINTLAKENLSEVSSEIDLTEFKIDSKIQFNNLHKARGIIEDYKVHYHRLNRIYSEFDQCGVNKSFSILQNLQSIYRKNSDISSPDQLFFQIIDDVQEKIISSSNFVEMPIDELDLAINILVVDAFVRCKIFENPNGVQTSDVTTR